MTSSAKGWWKGLYWHHLLTGDRKDSIVMIFNTCDGKGFSISSTVKMVDNLFVVTSQIKVSLLFTWNKLCLPSKVNICYNIVCLDSNALGLILIHSIKWEQEVPEIQSYTDNRQRLRAISDLELNSLIGNSTSSDSCFIRKSKLLEILFCPKKWLI